MNTTGIKFGNYHSYKQWKLRLKALEIEFPDEKTVKIDVEGSDGILDLTEAVNGSVRYKNRTLHFVFDARNNDYRHWTWLISDIANKLHGQKRRITLDFDPEYYYVGRCHINTAKTNEVKSEIAIDCDCEPFKTAVSSDNGDWLWDPFSFRTGVIHKKYKFSIDSPNAWQDVSVRGYEQNWGVSFECSDAIELKYDNTIYALSEGYHLLEEIVLEDGLNTLQFRGTGTVDVVAKGGSL